MEKINQPEGLCLMWYQCEKCKFRERIWNSRPRVTPFMVNCPKCQGTMTHVDWNLDKYSPNYVPKRGERIFIDWCRECAEEFYRQRIEREWEAVDYPLKEMFKTKDEAFKSLFNWEFGQPHIITI